MTDSALYSSSLHVRFFDFVGTLWHQIESGYNKEGVKIFAKKHKLGGGNA